MLYDLTNVEFRTRQLQRMLRFLSAALGDALLNANVTGSFDHITERAVRHFQQSNKLPVTGITDLDTWNEIVRQFRREESLRQPVLPNPIGSDVGFTSSRGEVSDTNMILQIMLNALRTRYNYRKIPVSGIFERLTGDAVRLFQAANGLPETGIADRVTWQKLAEEYNSAYAE
ncbi:MAG: peptidoglycan-binding protein [Eubacteriales bacterium]